ncbi:MAG: hypothetical protein M9887_01160 [Chitinophagales bacterium]|nr:hypothetical protein [Chitinophagales bacterium]
MKFFFKIWGILFAIGWLLSEATHSSLQYFTKWFGVISLLTTLLLVFSAKIKITPKTSAMIPLVIISLQMIASGAVFIIYFSQHKENVGLSLGLGGIVFLLFTVLEVYTAVHHSPTQS